MFRLMPKVKLFIRCAHPPYKRFLFHRIWLARHNTSPSPSWRNLSHQDGPKRRLFTSTLNSIKRRAHFWTLSLRVACPFHLVSPHDLPIPNHSTIAHHTYNAIMVQICIEKVWFDDSATGSLFRSFTANIRGNCRSTSWYAHLFVTQWTHKTATHNIYTFYRLVQTLYGLYGNPLP